MSCTTLLVGKNASYDGSTMIARNDDSGADGFTPKKFVVISSKEQKRKYKTVISHLEIDLPDNPMSYTAMPNAVKGKGIWAASGINEENIAMTATETITSNPRVLGADPLVEYDEINHISGGIGEEDIVYIVLPYIHSAREGVERLGSLLEKYGTYEMNGIAFQDEDEIWWFETIGGHNWIAKKVPDDTYVVMPNQLGMDFFDFEDAYGEQAEHMCSLTLKTLVEENHLDRRKKSLIQEMLLALMTMEIIFIIHLVHGQCFGILIRVPLCGMVQMRILLRKAMIFPGHLCRKEKSHLMR